MKIKIGLLIIIIAVLLSSTFIINAMSSEYNFNGYVIYVDAGHGGKDNGASYDSVLEDNINFNISRYLVEYLVEAGASVYTSRSDDYDLAGNYESNRKAKDLKRRVELINYLHPNLFLSIHLNAFSNDLGVFGGQVFFQNNENSKLLAEILQQKFNRLSGKNKKHKSGDYYLLNKTNPVGVIVECGFLSNEEERNKLVSEDYQRQVSKEIINGINEYFKKIVI